jgi:hypothetical protein
MTHTYPGENWSAQLRVLLERVENGDTITVQSEVAAELACRSLARMRPGLVIIFDVRP